MTETTAAAPAPKTVKDHAQDLGKEHSIWFKLTPFMKGDDPMGTVNRLLKKMNGVVPIKMRDEKIFLLGKVEHFDRIFVKKVDQYQKFFSGLEPIFGKSMITVDGNLWQNVRTPQQKSFHPKVYAEYIPYLQDALNRKEDMWAERAKSGESFEMVEETWTLACDMISKALFNREFPINAHAVYSAVKAYTSVSNHNELRVKKVHDGLQEVTSEEAAAGAIEAWHTVPDAIINSAPWDDREKYLLQLFQDLEADPENPTYDHEQAVDEMKQYLWAGTETTALTMAWCIYNLTQHPDALAKLRAETEEIMGDRTDPTWDDLLKMTYTRSVIQETMRMYPPAWGLIREATEEDDIDGHKIMPGDKVVACCYSAHHNEDYWSEPSKFIPERFAKEKMKKRVKYSYMPFGAGKRACIGGQLAMIENTMALSQLMRRFEPEYVGPNPVPFNITVTLTPKGGLQFKLHEREKVA